MKIIRPISRKDKGIFSEFSFKGTLGIRNLPHEEEKFDALIRLSETSFLHDIKKPNEEEYLFVLEDLSTGVVGGISGILASINHKKTLNYRIETLHNPSLHPAIHKETKILIPSSKIRTASEICALFLQPHFRHSGQGKLLSLSRFLFIACFLERFHKNIVAELRGYINQNQISPFWEAVGKHFCNLSFVELMDQIEKNTINIKEILPPYPLLFELLPREAQDVVGKTHEKSKPAFDMLINEGFQLTDEVDALEAGPSLIAAASKIKTISQSQIAEIELTNDSLQEEMEFIICNGRLDFRACYGHLKNNGKNRVIINREIASALNVKTGDIIRYVLLH